METVLRTVSSGVWIIWRMQLTDGSANLYQLVEHCEYNNLRDQMTHDYNVVRIWDSALSKRLPMDPDLTLEKAKKLVCERLREAVHEQQQFLTGKSSEGTTVEAVARNSGTKQVSKKSPRGPIQPPSRAPRQRRHQQICSCCGRGTHSHQACAAKDVCCYKCNEKGHYSSMYFTKSVPTISEEAD